MTAESMQAAPAKIIDARQASVLLGCSKRMVYDLAASGDLACFRLGTLVRFSESDVLEYQRQCRYTATKKKIAGALSLTAASQAPVESALESVFRKHGVAPRPTPTIGRNQPVSTRSRLEQSGLKLVSKTR